MHSSRGCGCGARSDAHQGCGPGEGGSGPGCRGAEESGPGCPGGEAGSGGGRPVK